jgi:cyanophycinase-like exopeptidase
VVTDYLHLSDVTGDTLGYVIDPGAYGATESYGGPNDTLQTRHVALHLLPPGSGFEFGTMTPSQGGTPRTKPSIAGRTFPSFAGPAGAGTITLSGGILGDPAGVVGDSFVADAGGSSARIVVLAAGYAKSGDAQADAKAIAAALAPSVASVTWYAIDARTKNDAAVAAVGQATGILVTGRDRSIVGGQLGSPVWTAARARWASGGAALLMDDAAAAVAGGQYVAQAPATDVEAGAIADATGVQTAAGLDLVGGLNVTPRLLPDQLWPQAFQLSRLGGTTRVAAGIDVGTAIRIAGSATTAIGDSAVVIIDGRQATWVTGGNGAIGGTWLVVDTFADGDTVAP